MPRTRQAGLSEQAPGQPSAMRRGRQIPKPLSAVMTYKSEREHQPYRFAHAENVSIQTVWTDVARERLVPCCSNRASNHPLFQPLRRDGQGCANESQCNVAAHVLTHLSVPNRGPARTEHWRALSCQPAGEIHHPGTVAAHHRTPARDGGWRRPWRGQPLVRLDRARAREVDVTRYAAHGWASLILSPISNGERYLRLVVS